MRKTRHGLQLGDHEKLCEGDGKAWKRGGGGDVGMFQKHWQGARETWLDRWWGARSEGAGECYGDPKISGSCGRTERGSSNQNRKQGRRRGLGKEDVTPLQVFGNLSLEPREELKREPA